MDYIVPKAGNAEEGQGGARKKKNKKKKNDKPTIVNSGKPAVVHFKNSIVQPLRVRTNSVSR